MNKFTVLTCAFISASVITACSTNSMPINNNLKETQNNGILNQPASQESSFEIEYMLLKSNTAHQNSNAMMKFDKSQLDAFTKANGLQLIFHSAATTTNNHSVPIYSTDNVLYVGSVTTASDHVTMNAEHTLLGTKMDVTPIITNKGVDLNVDYRFSKLINMVQLDNGAQYPNTMSTSFNYRMPFQNNELGKFEYVYNFRLDNEQYYAVIKLNKNTQEYNN